MTPAERTAAFSDLLATLAKETGLLENVQAALRAQRDAIAADDVPRLEAAGQRLSAALWALDRAKGTRAEVVRRCTGGMDVTLERLELALDGAAREALGGARIALRRAADGAQREAAITRRVLEGALGAGASFLQDLFVRTERTPAVYAATARPKASAPSPALLLDRTG